MTYIKLLIASRYMDRSLFVVCGYRILVQLSEPKLFALLLLESEPILWWNWIRAKFICIFGQESFHNICYLWLYIFLHLCIYACIYTYIVRIGIAYGVNQYAKDGWWYENNPCKIHMYFIVVDLEFQFAEKAIFIMRR